MKHVAVTRRTALLAALALAACAGTTTGGATRAPDLVPPDPAPAPVPPAASAPPPAAPTGPMPVVPPAATSAAGERNYTTLRIKVAGMTCPIRCVREVKEQLESVTGVLHVEIDQDRREAIVDVRPGTDPDAVIAGLRSPYSGRLL